MADATPMEINTSAAEPGTWRRLVLAAIAAAIVAMPGFAVADAGDLLARYLAAIGGKDAWASGRGEYVLAKISDPRFELPGTFEFCWSWDAPRSADRTRFQDFAQIRVFTGNGGWTQRATRGAPPSIVHWDDTRARRAVDEWSGNFEVLTHRLAAADPGVAARMGSGPWQDWLEISLDGQVVAHLLLGPDGSPIRFHRVFDDVRVRFGPLVARGAIRFPAWGAFEVGEPFDLIAFEILDHAPLGPFQPPDGTRSGFWRCD